MTCKDFRAVVDRLAQWHAAGMEKELTLTGSEVAAAVDHIRNCPSCNAVAVATRKKLSPDGEEWAHRMAAIVGQKMARQARFDPEMRRVYAPRDSQASKN